MRIIRNQIISSGSNSTIYKLIVVCLHVLNENDNEGQLMTHKENLAMPVLHCMLSKHLSSYLLFLHTPPIFR